MNRQNGSITLKVLIVILLISFVGTTFFLSYTISGLQRTINAQTSQILNLNNTISEMREQIDVLKETVQNNTLTTGFSYSQVYDEIKDSVVVIQVKGVDFSAQGSGFVYSYKGETIIITNNHVVDGATEIIVSFLNGNSYSANLAGTDPFSDLAILSSDAPDFELKPVTVTTSSTLKVGQPIIAVGNPFGLAGTMTTGVISQLGRTISESTTGGYAIADVIQLSAAINPGNSGGPLLNVLSEVIGITTAIVADSQGLGFAIPSDTILRELPYLVEGKPYPHPWLGVRGIDMNYAIAKVMELNVTYGWLIGEVIPNSPAEKAGLRGGTDVVSIDGVDIMIGGDVIIMIDGAKIRGGDDLSTYLERNTKPGQTIQITVMRSGQMVNISLTLGVRPPPS